MYKIPANTLFIGKNLIYVPECHSTNSLALELCQKTSVAEGTTVITDNQVKGRGQRGNTWFSEPNKNLTFSVVLKPTFLKPSEQFYLTIAISLALHDFLTQQVSDSVKIKWPNDLLINRMKTCGMLIENSIAGNMLQQSIVGIGLNVNQTTFLVDTATSMKLSSGREFNLPESLNLLLLNIEQRYLQLRNGNKQSLKTDYLNCLFGRNETRKFSDAEGVFEGVITGVTEEGKLLISKAGELKSYSLKEVIFL